MITAFGAFINAMGILLGALAGLILPAALSIRAQAFLRSALGAATIFAALRLVWISLTGTFWSCLAQLAVALAAIMLGYALGKALKLQKLSNRVGHQAVILIGRVQKNGPRNPFDGFTACAILLCAAPLGLIGAIIDGLTGYFWLLAVKAAIDGIAMTSFIRMFRWPAAMAAFPVFLLFNVITVTTRLYLAPFLDAHGLVNSVGAAAGFITCAVSLVVLETRKVELANYLPALAVAPALTWVLTKI